MGSLSNGCWKANAGLDQELKHSDGITLSHLTLLGCYEAPQGERYFALRGKTTRLGFVIICQMLHPAAGYTMGPLTFMLLCYDHCQ